MNTFKISFYPKPYDVESSETIALDLFLQGIKNGKWEDLVHDVRKQKTKEAALAKKKKLPSVTISGKFNKRFDNDIKEHSGYIGIDIDGVDDTNELKSILCCDKYVAACFVTVSGHGLCVLFKINPDKHKQAFYGIGDYLFNNYKIIIDPTSVNPSRARFVSWDTDIYIADKCERFTKYPKEVKKELPVNRIVYSGDDFDMIIQQVVERKLDLTQSSYYNFLRIGFGLADKFGEGGRAHFHVLAQYSPKYEPDIADKQYTACLNAHGANRTTIATIYYYAKQLGLQIYSQTTKTVVRASAGGRKAGLSPKQIAENLNRFENITGVDDLIEQAVSQQIEPDDESIIDELEMWIKQSFSLRRNTVNKFIENYGVQMTKVDMNTVYIRAKKLFPKLSYELIERLINSDFVPNYNPFLEYFEEHKEKYTYEYCKGAISELISCIETKDAEYAEYFATRWFVGMISSIYGTHSPLLLVLSGRVMNTGKTEFFRRLLPKALKKYYAESKLDYEKDDKILMTQRLIIMDDEMGGKSKREEKILKDLTSKQIFSLRAPYGHWNEDFERLAVLCGTTNDNEVLGDPFGNRRIIPVHVYSIDNDKYNKIDKNRVIIEAYWMYHAGFKWTLSREDIKYLGVDAGSFETTVAENELMLQYFEPAREGEAGATPMTATDMKVHIEKQTQQRLNLNRLSKELHRLGYEQNHVRVGMSTKRIYFVRHLIGGNQTAVQPGTSEYLKAQSKQVHKNTVGRAPEDGSNASAASDTEGLGTNGNWKANELW